ncbi:MAG TPA: MFS transporter [Nocardioidaceae bacterium]|nr:MFS transporter [Nocardioidaceae bacterium]
MSAPVSALGSRRAWLVWGTALSVYMLAVFHRTSLGVAGIIAADRFEISAGQLSTFVMVQLLVYAGMQVPVGALVDRYGSRRMLFVGLTMMTVAQLSFAFISSYPLGLAARVFVGAGDAMVFISVLRVASRWFSPLQTPVITQLTGMLGQLGAVGAAIPLSLALHQIGWTWSYIGAAFVGVVLAVALYLVVRDSPEREHEVLPLSWREVGGQVRMAWLAPGTRLGLWTHFTTQFSVTVMGLLWGFPYLVTVHDLSPGEAGALLTLMTLSAIVIGPLLGRQVARRPYHRSTMAMTLVLLIIGVWTVVLAWPGAAPLWLLVVLMIVVGSGGPASMVGFDLARSFNPVPRHGSATGIVNVGGFAASLFTIVGIGLVLDGLTAGDATDYSAGDFRIAMCVQYLVWAFGLTQLLRYRRRTRRHLWHTDPEAYDALRRGELVTSA